EADTNETRTKTKPTPTQQSQRNTLGRGPHTQRAAGAAPKSTELPGSGARGALVGRWFGSGLGELLGDHLGDLSRVQGRALAQVVPTQEQIQRVRVVDGLTDTADPGRVGTHHVRRGRELGLGRVVQDLHTL